jgi:hypothetical protein
MPQKWRNGPGIGTDGRFHNSGYNLGHVPFKTGVGSPHGMGFNAAGQPPPIHRRQRQDQTFGLGAATMVGSAAGGASRSSDPRGQRSNRGYQTPIMGDIETAYRRYLRFGLKVLAVFFLIVALIVAGAVLVVDHKTHIAADQEVSVPSLVNLSNVDAFGSLTNASLNYQQTEIASATVPFGQVISSAPTAGTKVKIGSTVHVFLSCGQPVPGFCS